MLKYSPVVKEGIPQLAPGSKDYNRYWSLQIDRCKNGYKPSGGVKIPGAYYFYLNFFQILARDEKTNRKRIQSPWYRDLDHEYFERVYTCKKEGRGLIVLKARDKGFSFMNAGLALYEWTFFPNNEIGVGAATPAYVASFRNKVVNSWNKLPPQIRHRKDLADNELMMKSGYRIKENGVWLEKGIKSIMHFRCMDNPEVFRGERFSMAIFEEFGEMKHGLRAYMATEACFKDGAIQFGIPIVGGTANIMNKSDDYLEMWYNPEKYNLEQFFIPASKVLFGFFNRKTGISDVEGGTEHYRGIRKKLHDSKDKTAYYLHIQEHPLVPEDAFVQSNRSPFDLDKLNEQIGKILANKSLQGMISTGDLVWNRTKTEVEWVLNPEGKMRILYHPKKDMLNLDIGAVDSYTQEEAPNSESKGCAMVFRRWTMNEDEPSYLPIAMYVDRPYTKDQWYENTVKLFTYYGAKTLTEYTDEGFFNYYINNNHSKLLKERPRAADAPWGKVANRYGVHMKSYQKNLIVDLLDDYIKKHVENIYFLELLQDLANFGIKNTDMAMTFGIVLLHDTDNSNIRVMNRKDLESKNNYFLPTYKTIDGILQVVNSTNYEKYGSKSNDPLNLLKRRI